MPLKIKYLSKLFFIVLIGVFVSSCINNSKKEVLRYYLIDATNSSASKNNTDLKLDIRELHIPQYLDRFQIVTRTSENRLRLAEFHQWGENLRENLIRTLITYLSRELGPANITSPLEHGKSASDYRVELFIERFELAADRHAILEFRWKIIDSNSNEIINTNHDTYTSSNEIDPDDYDEIILKMQHLFNHLCMQLAKELWLLS